MFDVKVEMDPYIFYRGPGRFDYSKRKFITKRLEVKNDDLINFDYETLEMPMFNAELQKLLRYLVHNFDAKNAQTQRSDPQESAATAAPARDN